MGFRRLTRNCIDETFEWAKWPDKQSEAYGRRRQETVRKLCHCVSGSLLVAGADDFYDYRTGGLVRFAFLHCFTQNLCRDGHATNFAHLRRAAHYLHCLRPCEATAAVTT